MLATFGQSCQRRLVLSLTLKRYVKYTLQQKTKQSLFYMPYLVPCSLKTPLQDNADEFNVLCFSLKM